MKLTLDLIIFGMVCALFGAIALLVFLIVVATKKWKREIPEFPKDVLAELNRIENAGFEEDVSTWKRPAATRCNGTCGDAECEALARGESIDATWRDL